MVVRSKYFRGASSSQRTKLILSLRSYYESIIYKLDTKTHKNTTY